MGGGRLRGDGNRQDLTLLSRVSLAEVVARLGDELRRGGLPVTPETLGRFALAISLARPHSLDDLTLLGRATLASDPAEVVTFDALLQRIFGGVWDPAGPRGDLTTPPPPTPGPGSVEAGQPVQGSAGSSPQSETERSEPADREFPLGLLAAAERLAERDFADCSEDELQTVLELVRRLPVDVPRRQTRRWRRTAGGGRVDLRDTLRHSHRTGGDPARLLARRRSRRPRRLVMLADVSGSMEPYTRIYLTLFHGAVRAARAETFVFATRLTRVTDALAASDPSAALQRAGAAVQDWAGGTLIGSAVESFNDHYGRRGMARGALVVIVSDGWEGADPDLLGRQMRRLSLLANRIVWVNPRSASRGFQPTTAGMAAALPFVDTLVSGHSLAAVQSLLQAIRGGESGDPPVLNQRLIGASAGATGAR